jgi:hypothetical protein
MTELVGDILKRKTQLEESTAKELSDYIASEIDVVGLLRHIVIVANGDPMSNQRSDYCNLLYTLGLGNLNSNNCDSDYEGTRNRWDLDIGSIKLFLSGVDFGRAKK